LDHRGVNNKKINRKNGYLLPHGVYIYNFYHIEAYLHDSFILKQLYYETLLDGFVFYKELEISGIAQYCQGAILAQTNLHSQCSMQRCTFVVSVVLGNIRHQFNSWLSVILLPRPTPFLSNVCGGMI
jgi:hypothetical protein